MPNYPLPVSNHTGVTTAVRSQFILVSCLLIGLVAHAQALPEPSTYVTAPEPELILQWLHSPNPRLQAWAARDILLYNATGLIPELQSTLERTTPATLSDAARVAGFRTTLAILDTLIQLQATVPAPTLARIEKLGYNAQVEELVLLSRLPPDEAEPGIRAFYKPASGNQETRVAAQLLARHPPKGFAAELLSTIQVTGHFFVYDPNSGMGGFGSGSSSCCGAGSGPMTDDWPEIGRYSFSNPPLRSSKLDSPPVPENEVLFLSAPDPIYLLRTVDRNYSALPCGGGLSSLNDAIRSHLVGTLLNGNPASPFPEQPVTLSILFTSREAYRARVQAFVDQQQQNFYQVGTALTALNLLTEEERQAAALRIHLAVQDSRVNPAEDLPAIPFRPPVQWVSMF